ncbi:AAA family ATPase [Pseudonocardia sp. GCM10023141]|uniref:AAA family ATPase n=1 Tax=Pseudonocardia sp. GCM10023141 TaxID=3252653 RepID=UPI003612EC3A
MKDGVRDPELTAEKLYVNGLYDRLEAERRAAQERARRVFDEPLESLGTLNHDRWQRDVAVRTWSNRSVQLGAARTGLCFGRLDRTGGVTSYIGRIGLFDDALDEPLLTDWRAPAARPFYCATVAQPEGVTRRRHFRTAGATVVAFHDDVLDADAVLDAGITTSHAGDAALFAAISAPRAAAMRDIVSTIQAEQDQIIRLPLAGTVVIEGGPGTGKTAVALHRVAFLLYEHRERLVRRGVLVVGPTPAFLTYIGEVLPALGETAVVFTTPGMVHHGLETTALDPRPVAWIKGGLGMVDVLRRAVADRQELPVEPLRVELPDVTVEIDHDLAAVARERARATGLPHNLARSAFRAAVGEALVERAVRAIGAGWLRDADLDSAPAAGVAADLRLELSDHPGFQQAIDALWPVLTPERLLADLYGSRERLAAISTDVDLTVLHRDVAEAWTVSDAPLLDEAVEVLGAVPYQPAPTADAAEDGAADDGTADDDAVFAEGVLEIFENYDRDDDESLRAVDVIDAARLAERNAAADHRTVVERAESDREWTYGHIVVDEAQELSEMDWHVLMRRCPTRSITAVGDLAQRGSAAGARSWAGVLAPFLASRWTRQQLSVNYRTSAEIMELAARVLPEIGPGLVAPASVRSTGDRPWVREVAATALGPELAAALAAELDGLVGTAAVIVPDGFDAPAELPVAVLTAAEAKGLEFDTVIVVEPGRIHARSPSDLYVALTRATRRLGLLHATPLPECLR